MLLMYLILKSLCMLLTLFSLFFAFLLYIHMCVCVV